jgi:hypothetical protein
LAIIDSIISDKDLSLISKKVKTDIYKPAFTFKTTVFLCGADINQKEKTRFKVAEQIKWRFWIDLVYPEDIFDELLFSSKTKDLLSLEGLLADSVDAIVIIPESPGSFAELGAFANNALLRKKIICLVDSKYKKNKSFINQGPIKLVKKANPKGVVYIDTVKNELDLGDLYFSLRRIKKSSNKISDQISLLQLENFLLPCIYLLEPISKEVIVKLVEHATSDQTNSFQTTTAALTILLNKKQIELTNDGFKLTDLGLDKFYAFQKSKTRIKKPNERLIIDNLRLEILNLKYRKKSIKV